MIQMNEFTIVYRGTDEAYREFFVNEVRPRLMPEQPVPVEVIVVAYGSYARKLDLILEAMERKRELVDLEDTLEDILNCADPREWDWAEYLR